MTTVIMGGGADATLAEVASAVADAVVMRPADLSREGWVFDPHDPASGSFVAASVVHPKRSATAVVPTITAVHPGELVWFDDADDRQYAASEMTALLRAWLGTFSETAVVGYPRGRLLAGAAQSPQQWERMLARAGFILRPECSSDDWICLACGVLQVSREEHRAEAEQLVASLAHSNYLWIEIDWGSEARIVTLVRDVASFLSEVERSAVIFALEKGEP